jgi:diguanylate cyclase (GGDEF)-like protein
MLGAAHTSDRQRASSANLDAAGVPWRLYAVMAVLWLAYLALLLANASGATLDGWGVAAFELLASALCLISGLRRPRARAVPLVLGASLFAWSFGHLAFTIESLGGATPSSPSPADGFYLSFFPLAYAALVLYLRGEVRRVATPSWLDGMVAGMGAAAVCAAFAFHAIQTSTGYDTQATAVNLAYPVGDVLLLLLVVGGTTVLSGRAAGPWLIVAGGIALAVVGDTFNLFEGSSWSSNLGTVLNDIAWPGAILAMSFAMWLPRVRSDPRKPQRPTGFLLPGLAAACGLGILLVGTFHPVDRVAIALAAATLVLVGVRMALSARTLRAITRERQRLSVTDHLTGLGNRRHLFDVLDAFFAEEAAAYSQRELAFLFIDLEHFKRINDAFGHAAGDEILRELGARLARALEPEDVLARIGGDEFGVVLLDADRERAADLAARIGASLEQPFMLESVRAQLAANIGIALAPTDARDSAGLISCADAAMYRAKLAAASSACYEKGLDSGTNRLRLADELRAAVDAGELVLHYQPQLDLRRGRVSSVEALVRWTHPTLGPIPPVKFLPLAEEAGLMGALTRLVLTQAVAQCASWRARGEDVRVSVNVSATDLRDDTLVRLVGGLLAEQGLPGSCLAIEITETSVIGEFERARAVVGQLRGLGVSVSIDDFGAGFTSLAYLTSLEVSELKLDRTLIARLASTERRADAELVRATAALGHALHLQVVAEGVEDQATLDLVSELGCDVVQGYFTGRPAPAGELELGAWPPRPSPSPAASLSERPPVRAPAAAGAVPAYSRS